MRRQMEEEEKTDEEDIGEEEENMEKFYDICKTETETNKNK